MPKLPSNKTTDLIREPTNQELIEFLNDTEELLYDIIDQSVNVEFNALRAIMDLRVPKNTLRAKCPSCKQPFPAFEKRPLFYCSCCQQKIRYLANPMEPINAKQQKPNPK